MKFSFEKIPGSITAPKGFLAAGVFCDIKKLGTGKGSRKEKKRDLAVIVSAVPAAVAGMFTTNQVCAAPVKICAMQIKKGNASAIVVNSGNANACTGAQGLRDTKTMAEFAAKKLNLSAKNILVASTGRIGVPLPMVNVKKGISAAAKLLNNSEENAHHVAEAIMTSDTRPKEIAIEFSLGGKKIRIGGVCKGAGMIHPGMSPNAARPAAAPKNFGALHATMLCFITTDVAIESQILQTALNEAVAQSFNRITVDGDMSTNDTVLILANGLAGNSRFRIHDSRFNIFQSVLNHLTLELAKMIVRDGEGVSRFVTIKISGAKNFADADVAVRAVGNSALVKTSWHGGDPNWGRILCALGYSSAKIVQEKIDVAYSLPGRKKLLFSLKRGQPIKTSFEALCKITAQKEFDLHINLNLGRASALLYASDLTEEYVDFNKGDVSNPSSLGG
ncbi:MAG: bifunctional glutamate N-acetyltransferase/amino-acid acetyltransferase ArgJ [Limisphaerales bacterium]